MLEKHFQGQLTDSWIQSVSQGAECRSLVQVCQAVYYAAGGIFEIHSMEDVKEFSAELDAISLTCFDIFEESHIPIVIPAPVHTALADITKHAHRKVRENDPDEVNQTENHRSASLASMT